LGQAYAGQPQNAVSTNQTEVSNGVPPAYGETNRQLVAMADPKSGTDKTEAAATGKYPNRWFDGAFHPIKAAPTVIARKRMTSRHAVARVVNRMGI